MVSIVDAVVEQKRQLQQQQQPLHLMVEEHQPHQEEAMITDADVCSASAGQRHEVIDEAGRNGQQQHLLSIDTTAASQLAATAAALAPPSPASLGGLSPSTLSSPTVLTVGSAVASEKAQQRQLNAMLDKYIAAHGNNLYPSREEKERLATQMNVTYIQVNRWFANRRRKQTKTSRKVLVTTSPVAGGGKILNSRANTPAASSDMNKENAAHLAALSATEDTEEQQKKMVASQQHPLLAHLHPDSIEAAHHRDFQASRDGSQTGQATPAHSGHGSMEAAAALLAALGAGQLQHQQQQQQQQQQHQINPLVLAALLQQSNGNPMALAAMLQQLQQLQQPQLQQQQQQQQQQMQQQFLAQQLVQLTLLHQQAAAAAAAANAAASVAPPQQQQAPAAAAAPPPPAPATWMSPPISASPEESELSELSELSPRPPASPSFKDPHNIADPALLKLLNEHGELSEKESIAVAVLTEFATLHRSR